NALGQYQFDGILAFGSYCLAVRALDPPNDSILIPGQWTFPPGLIGADAFANATVESGTILSDKDFGWDYQFLPVAAAPAFTLEKNAFCRKGPGINYLETTAVPLGETVDVLGVSPDGAWYYVLWSKFTVRCWVAESTGRLSSALLTIPVLTPVPTPLPTTVPPSPVPTSPTQGTQ
ncbi:MAG TPA: SH3 domain-containing protein, partial [Anaerolineales bacterium]|nr:SH3 domain-containing protein [Anaerolineales bacterium]